MPGIDYETLRTHSYLMPGIVYQTLMPGLDNQTLNSPY